MDTPDHSAESEPRGALSADVRVFVESHLRELAQVGRLGELAHSRDALMKYYRALRNDAAVYVLASAPRLLHGIDGRRRCDADAARWGRPHRVDAGGSCGENGATR